MRHVFRNLPGWWARVSVARRAASYALKDSEPSSHVAVSAFLSGAGKWAASANAAGLIVALGFISSATPYLFDGDCVSVVGNLNIIKTARSFDIAFRIGAVCGLLAISWPILWYVFSTFFDALFYPKEGHRAFIFVLSRGVKPGVGAALLQAMFVILSFYSFYIGLEYHSKILTLFKFDNLVGDYKSADVEECKRKLLTKPDLTSAAVRLPQPLLPSF